MKTIFLSMALVALFACPTLAEQSFDLGSYELAGGQGVAGSFFKDASDGGGESTTVNITFDYVNGAEFDASWASDLLFSLEGPGGQSILIGGFDNETIPSWDFAGSDSTNNGTYGQTFDIAGLNKVGDWAWSITNDWAADGSPNQYNNVTLTFGTNVPEPTSFMMFGVLGGLAAWRRRS